MPFKPYIHLCPFGAAGNLDSRLLRGVIEEIGPSIVDSELTLHAPLGCLARM